MADIQRNTEFFISYIFVPFQRMFDSADFSTQLVNTEVVTFSLGRHSDCLYGLDLIESSRIDAQNFHL